MTQPQTVTPPVPHLQPPSPPCPHDAERIVIYWHGPKSAEFKGGTYMQTEVCMKCGAGRDGFVRRFAFLGIMAKT